MRHNMHIIRRPTVFRTLVRALPRPRPQRGTRPTRLGGARVPFKRQAQCPMFNVQWSNVTIFRPTESQLQGKLQVTFYVPFCSSTTTTRDQWRPSSAFYRAPALVKNKRLRATTSRQATAAISTTKGPSPTLCTPTDLHLQQVVTKNVR